MENHEITHKNNRDPRWGYYRYGLNNLLRMGHCAPTVMQTILDIFSTDKQWLVRLSAGMPGGLAIPALNAAELLLP